MNSLGPVAVERPKLARSRVRFSVNAGALAMASVSVFCDCGWQERADSVQPRKFPKRDGSPRTVRDVRLICRWG